MKSRDGLTRRTTLGLIGSGLAAGGLATLAPGLGQAATPDQVLRAGVIDHTIRPPAATSGMMSFSPDGPPPVLRMRRSSKFIVDVVNTLPEPTTVHWHGLRIPNNQDGVPYLTQWPIMQDETMRYAFAAPDAGTYWYHPHCNTLEQMGRGMTGVLIVEDDEDTGFDDELVLNLRDFRLDGKGQFIKMFKARQAARGGTLGTVQTVNWKEQPTYDLAAGSLIRMRLAATDVTRLYNISVSGADSQLIALDGHPVPTGYQPSQILLGAGQRADIALRVPATEGNTAQIMTKGSNGMTVLARVRAVGRSAYRRLEELRPLTPNPVAEPDLDAAEVIPFTFGWAPGDAPKTSICGTLGYTFWSINRTPWPGDFPEAPGAIATLKQGRSYIFRLRNETRYNHPIHLHGMTFRLLRSDKRKLAPLLTDTALLQADETMDIALVADNVGDWVFHCHVIEHQKTGLTAYVRVE